MWDFFFCFVYFVLRLLINLVSVSVQKPGIFFILAKYSSSKQHKKNSTYPFVEICEQGTCAKFQQTLLKSKVCGACQSFQFFRQNSWFRENNRALSKFLYGILYYLISITKLYRKSVHKAHFHINHATCLKKKKIK